MAKTPQQQQIHKKVAKKNSTPSSTAGRSKATKNREKEAMVVWLEMDVKNFNLITGNGISNYSGMVAGAKLKKTDAYVSLADFVNNNCGTSWTPKNAEARYKAYFKKYQKIARLVSSNTGKKFCVSLQDHARGIYSIELKKEALCSFFTRMDTLFGGRQNVVPSHTMEPHFSFDYALPTATDSDSEDEGDNDSEEENSDDESSLESAAGEDDDEAAHHESEEHWQDDQSRKIVLHVPIHFLFYCFVLVYYLGRSTLDLHALDVDNVPAECNANSSRQSSSTAVRVASPVVSASPARGVMSAPPSGQSSSSSPIHRPPTTPAKKSSVAKKRSAVEISPELQNMCEEVNANHSSSDPKLTSFKQQNDDKGGKKDFSTVYAMGREKEIDLETERFAFTKSNYPTELALREKAMVEETKRAALVNLIQTGKSSAEVKEFMKILFE